MSENPGQNPEEKTGITGEVASFVSGENEAYDSPRGLSAGIALLIGFMGTLSITMAAGEPVVFPIIVVSVYSLSYGIVSLNRESVRDKSNGSIALVVGVGFALGGGTWILLTKSFLMGTVFFACWTGLLGLAVSISGVFTENHITTSSVALKTMIAGSISGMLLLGAIIGRRTLYEILLVSYEGVSTPVTGNDTQSLLFFFFGLLVCALLARGVLHVEGRNLEGFSRYSSILRNVSYGLGFMFVITLIARARGGNEMEHFINLVLGPTSDVLRMVIHARATFGFLGLVAVVTPLIPVFSRLRILARKTKKAKAVKILGYLSGIIIVVALGFVSVIVTEFTRVKYPVESPEVLVLFGLGTALVVLYFGLAVFGKVLVLGNPRLGLSAGVTLLLGGSIVSALMEGGFGQGFNTLVSVVCVVLVWDIGENAVNMGEYMGKHAETRMSELTHATSSILVGVVTVVGAYTLYLITKTTVKRSAIGLGLLVLSAIVLSKALESDPE